METWEAELLRIVERKEPPPRECGPVTERALRPAFSNGLVNNQALRLHGTPTLQYPQHKPPNCIVREPIALACQASPFEKYKL